MTPADRIRLRAQEARAVQSLLDAQGQAAAAALAAMRAEGLETALAEMGDRRQMPEPLPRPQVFGPQAVARLANAVVAALPPAPPAADTPPAALPAAPVARRPGPKAGEPTQIYTEQRLAYLREQWGLTTLTTEEIRDRLNEMPGPPIVSVGALVAKTKTLPGLPRRPHWTQRLAPEERRAAALRISEGARHAQQVRAAALLSPERDALIRELWPDLRVTVPEIARRASALPPGATVDANWVWRRAQALDLPSSRHAARTQQELAGDAPPPPLGGPRSSLTEERAALLRETWGDLTVTMSDLLRRYNALPGRAAESTVTLYNAAKRLGLPPRAEAEPAQAPAAELAQPPAPPAAPAAPEPAEPPQAAPPAPEAPPRRWIVQPSPHVPEAAWRADPLGTLTEEQLADARDVILARGLGAKALEEETDMSIERCRAVAEALRRTLRKPAA